MKALTIVLVFGIVATSPAGAHQRTTGDIISENFNRGRQMREAMDARREKAAEEQRQADGAREAAAFRAAEREVAMAKINPSLTLRSKNGLPDIRISDSPVSLCAAQSKAAFTSTAGGKPVFGCATSTGSQLEVNWAEFGKRSYSLDEWEELSSDSADHVPLGG